MVLKPAHLLGSGAIMRTVQAEVCERRQAGMWANGFLTLNSITKAVAKVLVAAQSQALKGAGALAEAQTASVVFDADGKRTADAQAFPPFSVGCGRIL